MGLRSNRDGSAGRAGLGGLRWGWTRALAFKKRSLCASIFLLTLVNFLWGHRSIPTCRQTRRSALVQRSSSSAEHARDMARTQCRNPRACRPRAADQLMGSQTPRPEMVISMRRCVLAASSMQSSKCCEIAWKSSRFFFSPDGIARGPLPHAHTPIQRPGTSGRGTRRACSEGTNTTGRSTNQPVAASHDSCEMAINCIGVYD